MVVAELARQSVGHHDHPSITKSTYIIIYKFLFNMLSNFNRQSHVNRHEKLANFQVMKRNWCYRSLYVLFETLNSMSDHADLSEERDSMTFTAAYIQHRSNREPINKCPPEGKAHA